MTADEVAEALRQVEEACPCRDGCCCEAFSGAVVDCKCMVLAGYGLDAPEEADCLWPGHAAILRYGDLCRKAGREAKDGE